MPPSQNSDGVGREGSRQRGGVYRWWPKLHVWEWTNAEAMRAPTRKELQRWQYQYSRSKIFVDESTIWPSSTNVRFDMARLRNRPSRIVSNKRCSVCDLKAWGLSQWTFSSLRCAHCDAFGGTTYKKVVCVSWQSKTEPFSSDMQRWPTSIIPSFLTEYVNNTTEPKQKWVQFHMIL